MRRRDSTESHTMLSLDVTAATNHITRTESFSHFFTPSEVFEMRMIVSIIACTTNKLGQIGRNLKMCAL
jgi:hypothetical protein